MLLEFVFSPSSSVASALFPRLDGVGEFAGGSEQIAGGRLACASRRGTCSFEATAARAAGAASDSSKAIRAFPPTWPASSSAWAQSCLAWARLRRTKNGHRAVVRPGLRALVKIFCRAGGASFSRRWRS